VRRLVGIAALVVVGVTVLSLLGGDEGSRTFDASLQERARLDEGLGAVAVFSGPVREDGERIGRLDGECRTTSLEPEPRERCALTLTLGDGEEEVQLAGVRRVAAEDVVLGVTGGSGGYAGAEGDAVLRGERLELALGD